MRQIAAPTPTHTLLANEASPQQNAAVNYRCQRLTDELTRAVRARLVIAPFEVGSYSTLSHANSLQCFPRRWNFFCADWFGGAKHQELLSFPGRFGVWDDFQPLACDVAALMGSDSPQQAIIKERDGEQAGAE